MNTNKILLVILLSAGVCDATAQNEASSNFKAIFQSLSSKNALTMSFRQHLKKMHPFCVERRSDDPDYVRKGNIACVKETSILTLSMSGSEDPAVGMINATVGGTENCAYMRSILTQQYGKPTKSKGTCDSEWSVKSSKGKPAIYAVLEKSEEENVVYFAHQEEQGP